MFLLHLLHAEDNSCKKKRKEWNLGHMFLHGGILLASGFEISSWLAAWLLQDKSQFECCLKIWLSDIRYINLPSWPYILQLLNNQDCKKGLLNLRSSVQYNLTYRSGNILQNGWNACLRSDSHPLLQASGKLTWRGKCFYCHSGRFLPVPGRNPVSRLQLCPVSKADVETFSRRNSDCKAPWVSAC